MSENYIDRKYSKLQKSHQELRDKIYQLKKQLLKKQKIQFYLKQEIETMSCEVSRQKRMLPRTNRVPKWFYLTQEEKNENRQLFSIIQEEVNEQSSVAEAQQNNSNNKNTQQSEDTSDEDFKVEEISKSIPTEQRSKRKRPQEKQNSQNQEQIQEIKKLISQLNRQKKLVQHFDKPVDYKKMELMDYPEIIKDPKDLGTINKNINNYESVQDIITDIRKVWLNAMQYNPPTNMVHSQAIEASNVFEQYLNQNKILRNFIPLPVGLIPTRWKENKFNLKRSETEETICMGRKKCRNGQQIARNYKVEPEEVYEEYDNQVDQYFQASQQRFHAFYRKKLVRLEGKRM